MSYYLLEIGCEELPAAFVTITAEYVASEAKKQLEAMHLEFTDLKSSGTPRRIYLYINGLPDKQEDRDEAIQGPPAKIAFNADGSVSEVGLKFARSKGIDESTITKKDSGKGECLSGIKRIKGGKSQDLIAGMASHIVRSIPFAKSMRWGNKDMRFGRPLKYLLSLWNGNLLNLDIDEVKSTTKTSGHRFLAPGMYEVSDFSSYTETLKKSFVIVDINERKAEITRQMNALAQEHGYEIPKDENLLNEVTNLVEYPHAVEGTFEEEFLELPAQVLITSMKHHQKYFPTYKNGVLQSRFIGISNVKPEKDQLIREGYERVLRARLNDALFFYNNDKNIPLEERVEMLKKVVYQEKLGTSYEKMERFRELGLFLAKSVAPFSYDKVKEAATLAKADLMCEMVYEFPELQGFMGMVYAGIQGKDVEIAAAIREHYMPRFADDDLPETETGRIVAISDKLDTITGAFAINMIPTGNVDPYGLRRSAIGIINIIENAGWHINFRELADKALSLVKPKATQDIAETAEKVINFFIQRHKQLLISRGETDADAYDAAMVNFTDFISQKSKAVALTAAKKSDQFISIAQSFKRINNILKKNNHTEGDVKIGLLKEAEEKSLFETYRKLQSIVASAVKEDQWHDAINTLIGFASPLNAFFDKVMVMAPETDLRENRLTLLGNLRQLFISIGDLGEIVQ